jgi:hypothetical protein
VDARNGLEHGGWQLPRVAYAVNGSTVSVSELIIKSQLVTAFVKDMTNRLTCFVEDVAIHCIQRHMPAGFTLTIVLQIIWSGIFLSLCQLKHARCAVRLPRRGDQDI